MASQNSPTDILLCSNWDLIKLFSLPTFLPFSLTIRNKNCCMFQKYFCFWIVCITPFEDINKIFLSHLQSILPIIVCYGLNRQYQYDSLMSSWHSSSNTDNKVFRTIGNFLVSILLTQIISLFRWKHSCICMNSWEWFGLQEMGEKKWSAIILTISGSLSGPDCPKGLWV